MPSSRTPPGYYDRFDPNSAPYKRILFNPGVPLQTAELNEMQSILGFEHEQLATSIYKEGAAVSGMMPSLVLADSFPLHSLVSAYVVGDHVNDGADAGYVCMAAAAAGTALTDTSKWARSYGYVSMSIGKMYAQGHIHVVPASGNLEITASGIERVGVLVDYAVVTIAQDATLSDPAVGYENYNKPGADRLSYSYSYALNNDNSVTVLELVDGQINQHYTQLRAVQDSVLKVLSARTQDESGSYTVDPYTVTVGEYSQSDPRSAQYNRMLIKGGTAYVNGWGSRNEVTYLNLEKPVTTLDVSGEAVLFADATEVYSLSDSPVRTMSEVLATIMSPAITLTRGIAANGLDDVPAEYRPVQEIVSISGYTANTDYVRSGNSVSWAPAGAEPAAGATYQVVVRYTKALTKSVRTLDTVASTDVVRGSLSGSGTFDYISPLVVGAPVVTYSEINYVASVVQGTTTHVNGVDFTLDAFNGKLVWIAAGPTSGSTYTVQGLSYWRVDIPGHYIARDSYVNASAAVQYQLTPAKTPAGNTINYRSQIAVTAPTPALDIVNGSYLYVSYLYALPRVDSLYLDDSGRLAVALGVPSSQPSAVPYDWAKLRLCTIYNPPEGDLTELVIIADDNQRMTMLDLRTMLQTVKDTQYNLSVFQLYQNTINKNLPTDKKAIWAESFGNPSLGDLTHPDFDITYDFLHKRAYLPQESELHSPESSWSTTAVDKGTFFIPPYTNQKLLVQPFYTDSRQISAYPLVNLRAKIVLTPEVDHWVEYNNITVAVDGQPYTITRNLVRNLVQTTSNTNLAWKTHVSDVTTTDIEYIHSSSTGIEYLPLPYARQIPVTVSGIGFTAGEDNVSIYFNGIKVEPTASGPSVPGTEYWTVKADADGDLQCSFVIPAEQPSGTNMVDAVGASAQSAGSRASAIMASDGWLHRTVRTVTTTAVTTVTNTHTTLTFAFFVNRVDPLAQTFISPFSCFLTKLDLFFTQKPIGGNIPENFVEVEIRDVVNGVPGNTVIGHSARLYPSSVSAVSTAIAPTTFTLLAPAYLERNREYCFVVKCESPMYSVAIARVGDRDPALGFVNANPSAGVMLTSANASTWSPEQNADAKFNLYCASFTGEATVDYGVTTTSQNRSRFEFAVTGAVPNNSCRVRYEYSLDGVSWVPFTNRQEVNLRRMFTSMRLRAVLQPSSDKLVAPIVYKDARLIAYNWKASGAYLNRTVRVGTSAARYVHVWYDVYVPAGVCTVTPQVSIDGGAFTNMSLVTADTVDFGDGYKELHYQYDNTTGFTSSKLKLLMSTVDQTITPVCTRLRQVVSAL